MSTCFLCLQALHTPDAAGAVAEFIEIYSSDGVGQNIANIVATHFWLKPKHDAYPPELLCISCWQSLREFHNFYLRVAKVHNYFVAKQEEEFLPATAAQAQPAHDPFLNDAAGVNLNGSEFCNNKLLEDLAADCLNAAVKVEELEFEPLPQCQVLENTHGSALCERPKRACKKSRTTRGKTNKNKVENDDYDSEPELPLAVLMQVDYKTDVKVDAAIEADATADEDQLEPIKRRRGRPRKVKKEATETATSTIATTNPMAEVVSEDEMQDTHADAAVDDAASGTNDSASSSNDSSDEDSDDTWNDDSKVALEQYAIIPKRVVVKPKKYRKREKPVVPPKRLSREEIERRVAQQATYDEIITSFVGKYVCPKCNLLVKNFGDMKKHFRASHKDEPGYMVCCGRKFVLRRALADHVLMHRNPEHFKCTICARIFNDSRTLEIHELAHTNPAEVKEKKKIFQCDKCPKNFTTKASFEHHSYAKHVPKSEFKFNCNVCNKKLPTARKLKDHMKYTHDPESAIMCDKCGKTLRSQSNLKKHHLIEHSDQPRPAPVPMQCEICGTWLRHLAGLRQHMRSIHEDTGGEHRCHICNKTSTNARALKRHIYHNHECERKFKCTMCEKAFKRPQDLREHTSTHTGEVLYTCPNCPMTFFSNANMYKHRQRLHRAEWEADRKKPNVNIMQQAVGATVAMKLKQSIGATSAFFSHQQLTDGDVQCKMEFP